MSIEQETHDVKRPGIIRRVCAKTPALIIALVSIAILWGIKYACSVLNLSLLYWNLHYFEVSIWILMGAAVFSAGAVKRLNWKHLLLMLGLFALFKGAEYLLNWCNVIPDGYHPYLWLIEPTLFFWLLGLGEAWTARHWRSLRMIFWTFLAAVSLAGLFKIITCMAGWSEIFVNIPVDQDGYTSYGLVSLLYWPVMAVLAWIGIPIVLAIPGHGRRYLAAAGGGCLAAILLSVSFFHFGVFHLAEPSLQGKGPFARWQAAVFLEERGRPKDFSRIMQALKTADWNACRDEVTNNIFEPDWRSVAITILSRHESTAKPAADMLADMLRKKRTPILAKYAAPLLAQENKISIAPILLRYVFDPQRMTPLGECATALEKMGVPEVACVILQEALIYDRPKEDVDDFPISPSRRQRLTRLVGADMGANYVPWEKEVVEIGYDESSKLPQAVQREIDREMNCYERYMMTFDLWIDARDTLYQRRLEAAGKMKLPETVYAYKQKVGDAYIPEQEIPYEVWKAAKELEAFKNAATADMEVPKPDVNAPTIEYYEREVDAYEKAVKEKIRQYIPPLVETEPATQPI